GTLARPADNLDSVYITGVAEDSRRVRAGELFLARRGRGTDGHGYIPTALAAGAVAVAGELAPDDLPEGMPAGIPYLQVSAGRTALALLSAALHHFPSPKLTVIGGTGTDG